MAKSKYTLITCWIVISFNKGLLGHEASSYMYKITFSSACPSYKTPQEGLCRNVPASVIHPPGFCILGNNLSLHYHKLYILQGQRFTQYTR